MAKTSLNVNIITEQGSWILRRMSQEIAKQAVGTINVEISTEVNEYADVQYFMNYALYEPSEHFSIAYFTHKEPKSISQWNMAEQDCQVGVYMADRYKPKSKIAVKIYPPGVDVSTGSGRIRVGVVGRVYESGRKGERGILKVDEKVWRHIEWRFLGSGWDDLVLKAPKTILNWRSDVSALQFYQDIDFLLCLASYEGGPVPNLEAAKLGVPIISTDVGNSEVWGKFATLIDDHHDAVAEIGKMIESKRKRKTLIQRDWRWFGVEHFKLFHRISREARR